MSSNNPKIIDVEGMEIFEENSLEKIFTQVSTTFQSPPKLISKYDPIENPSERTVELKKGYKTGISLTPKDDKIAGTDKLKYYIWDMTENLFQSFLKYVNSEKPFENCEYIVAKTDFEMDHLQDDEIYSLSKMIEGIYASAYITGSPWHLRLYIRIQLNPSVKVKFDLKRCVKIFERTVEIYFHELKGLSAEVSPCFTPAIPKVVSMSIIASDDFMKSFGKDFSDAISMTGLNIRRELLGLLEHLGYDGSGFPSVIRASKDLYYIIWQACHSNNGRSFYLVYFSNRSDLSAGRMKHTLPVELSSFSGSGDMVADSLSYISFWFSLLEFCKYKLLKPLQTKYTVTQQNSLNNALSYTTGKDKNALIKLLRIKGELHKLEGDLEKTFGRLNGFESLYLSQFYFPELAVAPINIFDAAILTEKERKKLPITLSRSLQLESEKVKEELMADVKKIFENTERRIDLINAWIQLKLSRTNTLLILMTAALVLITIVGLFGLHL